MWGHCEVILDRLDTCDTHRAQHICACGCPTSCPHVAGTCPVNAHMLVELFRHCGATLKICPAFLAYLRAPLRHIPFLQTIFVTGEPLQARCIPKHGEVWSRSSHVRMALAGIVRVVIMQAASASGANGGASMPTGGKAHWRQGSDCRATRLPSVTPPVRSSRDVDNQTIRTCKLPRSRLACASDERHRRSARTSKKSSLILSMGGVASFSS
jgi:hypothetical protein